MNKSVNTINLLRCLSTHLSSRKYCRGIQYYVNIDKSGMINFTPDILVYPSKYKRRQEDKIPVLSHVLSNHFEDVVLNHSDNVWIVNTDKIVPGEYIYQLSVDKRYRRWYKEKECNR